MQITIMTLDEQFVTLDVDHDESVENVKALLEVETSVAVHQQQLHFNGKEIRNSDRLVSVGVREGDLITMLSPNAGPSPNELKINSDGSASDPASLQRRIQSDSQLMSQLLQDDPALGQAILGSDLDKMQNILRERHQQKLQLRSKQMEELNLMHADPFDVESQRKIEAAIRQKGIDENMEAALEYNPEAFARVVMLYIDMEVNGIPLKAFVDSGAQSTIISKSCAERCGLLRLMDQRYRGYAVGVGQSEILGRIHVASIKIGHIFFPCSFTVLDAPNMDFLFGLDMLRKHQCIIDLKENVLRVGGGEVSVPFLQEKDIPSHIRGEEILKHVSPGLASNPWIRATGMLPASLFSGSGQQETSRSLEKSASASSGSQSSGTPQNNPTLGVNLEPKVAKLVELGFDPEAAKQALRLFNGNEEQAASYLFGGAVRPYSKVSFMAYPLIVEGAMKPLSSSHMLKVKRKVVLRLCVGEKKKRSKALKLSAGFPGVLSAGLRGDMITVVGEAIDSVSLVIALRKKFGFVELLRVADIADEDEFEERTEELDNYWIGQKVHPSMLQNHGYNNPQQSYITQQHSFYDAPYSSHDSSCNIM